MVNGIINVYKEKGYTSFDVVAKLRGIFKQKKIGHTGTLDPDATGVLPVCLGKATKLCDLLTDKDKTYEAVMLLGMTTDTQDITGRILEEKSTETLTADKVREVIESFIGDYDQIPPMYSAKKVNGKKLYELARQGIVIERKPCPVTLSSIIIKKIDLPYVTFEVTCSKGTYIRSLCRDIGEKAGCGGCMAGLVRTRVSSFKIEDGFTLSEVEAMRDADTLLEHIVPVDEVFLHLPAFFVKKEGEKLLYNGNPISLSLCALDENSSISNWQLYEDLSSNEQMKMEEADTENLGKKEKSGKDGKQYSSYTVGNRFRVYDNQKNFIGIYQLQEKKMLKPYKLFL